MIDLSKNALEQMKGATIALVFGERIGWALFNTQQFFKGSIPHDDPDFAHFLNQVKPSSIIYLAIEPGDTRALGQARKVKDLGKSLTAFRRSDITKVFLTGTYNAKDLQGKVKEETENRNWHCPDNQAAMALAVMECYRNGQ